MKSKHLTSQRFLHALACAWFGLAACVSPMASAAVFENLYRVTVDQQPGADNSREVLVRRGMATLLTRITGQRDIAADPRVSELLSGASRYYDYLEPTGTGVRVGFRRAQINDALDSLGLPIWVAERPATMLWLAVDFGDGQRAMLVQPGDATSTERGAMIGVASNPLDDDKRELFDEVVLAVSRAIDERGLPVVLPVLDPVERQRVRFADVWGGFDVPVMELAENYRVDAVLMAAVNLSDDSVRAVANDQSSAASARSSEAAIRWTLRRGQRRQARLSTDFRAGIDWIADQFASEFTTTGGARITWLTVRGIHSFPDFGRTRDYLESVSLVESVEPEILTADGDLLFRVAARGDDRQLRQVLALDGELESVQSETGLDYPENTPLVFLPSWRQQDRDEALP